MKAAHQQVWSILQRTLVMGHVPPLVYTLGGLALHAMCLARTHRVAAPVSTFYGVSLVDAEGRLLVAPLERAVGVRPRQGVSAKIVEALQALHDLGLVDTAPATPIERAPCPLGSPHHFTTMVELRGGVDWSEDTPLLWSLFDLPLEALELRLAGSFPSGSQQQVASFL